MLYVAISYSRIQMYNYKKFGRYITRNLATNWLDSKWLIEIIHNGTDYFSSFVARGTSMSTYLWFAFSDMYVMPSDYENGSTEDAHLLLVIPKTGAQKMQIYMLLYYFNGL